VKAYSAETTEAFLDGHVSAFAFFGGVPLSVLYDNLKIAVARICGDGRREQGTASNAPLSELRPVSNDSALLRQAVELACLSSFCDYRLAHHPRLRTVSCKTPDPAPIRYCLLACQRRNASMSWHV
jgi:hypothetical protein